jgi:hypothetical protein
VEPASNTSVSPQVAALMAFCKLCVSPEGTLRIQLEPVVNVGQAVAPCVGRVRSTVFCGNVGKTASWAETFTQAHKHMSIAAAVFSWAVPLL